LSSRNLKRSKAVTASELNTYALMNANSVVLFEGTVEGVVSNLSK
jgi:large subunit ribosomal protein L4